VPIRAVSFDADGTLWDFPTVASEANRLLIERLRREYPEFSAGVDELVATHRQVVESSPPGTPYAAMRRQAISRFVREHVGDVPGLADDLTDWFFDYRDSADRLFDDVEDTLDRLKGLVLGVITSGTTRWTRTKIGDRFSFWLAADQVGLRKPDPRVFRMAAAAADCHPREMVHVGDEVEADILGAKRAGVRAVLIDRHGRIDGSPADAVIRSLAELPDLLRRWDEEEEREVGVGPHPEPWPNDPRLDPELLARGDRRNVVDRYRYWKNEAIVEDLDRSRHPFHVAIENWRHDLNIGTVVRTANAFNAAGVHIVGLRRWNRRGAMVTDRYMHIHHHPDTGSLLRWADDAGLPIIGVDNLPGAEPIEKAPLPKECIFLFGQEGTGLSEAARAACERVLSITQFGSTRSINAGVAAGIAMHTWVCQHAEIG
jgi:HAD superfamily hydrolase (TIGR01509 family)